MPQGQLVIMMVGLLVAVLMLGAYDIWYLPAWCFLQLHCYQGVKLGGQLAKPFLDFLTVAESIEGLICHPPLAEVEFAQWFRGA